MDRLSRAPVIAVPLAEIEVGTRLRGEDGSRASASLIWSIKTRGLIHPIVVRPGEGEAFDLVAGARRLAAVRELGWRSIPARIVELGDEAKLDVERDENLERLDLVTAEKAKARREWALAEYHARREAIIAERKMAQIGPRSGPPPTEESDREVASATGASRAAVQRDRLHVAAVERYPMLAGLAQHLALEMANSFDRMDEGARPALVDLVAAEMQGHPKGLPKAVRALSGKAVALQAQIAELWRSDDPVARDLAVALAMDRSPEADPRAALIEGLLALFKDIRARCRDIVRESAMTPLAPEVGAAVQRTGELVAEMHQGWTQLLEASARHHREHLRALTAAEARAVAAATP